MTRTLSIFGATGSVGLSTLDLVRQHREQYRVVALTANGNAADLAKLAREFEPEMAVVADEAAYPALKEALTGTATKAAAGPAALIEAAQMGADWTMAAIVGQTLGHKVASRLPLVGDLADQLLVSRLRRQLAEYGHAEFKSDGALYRPATS